MKINLKPADIYFYATLISSGGLVSIVQALGSAMPTHAQAIANIAAVLVAISGLVAKAVANKAGAPATSIIADAPVVPAGTTVLHADTPHEATVISSTSTLLPEQPAAPPQTGT